MKPLFKVPLIYGAVAGMVGSALVIALYYLNRHPFLIPVFFDFRIILFAIFIFFTLKELREFHYGGILYFWQGLIASFTFTAIFALIAAVVIGVFATIVPGFLSSYIQLSIEQLKALPETVVSQIGKDVFARNLEMLPSTNVLDLATLYFWQSFMISFFISVILSVILRRQPKI